MRTGAIRLFQFAGITVYLHFTWFIIAAIDMTILRGIQSAALGRLTVSLACSPSCCCMNSDMLCLPSGRRRGKSHYSLAARRHCICKSAAKSRRLPLEYRRRTAGQCCSHSGYRCRVCRRLHETRRGASRDSRSFGCRLRLINLQVS